MYSALERSSGVPNYTRDDNIVPFSIIEHRDGRTETGHPQDDDFKANHCRGRMAGNDMSYEEYKSYLTAHVDDEGRREGGGEAT